MDSIQDVATFHRTGLLLGLTTGHAAVRWAEEAIETDPLAPGAVFDVVLTSPLDLTALRFALQPLAHPNEPPPVLRALFDRLRLDLEAGRRSVRDTVTVFSQIRRTVTISAAWHARLDAFEDDLMLASAGVVGEVAPVETAVCQWLGSFAGAEAALLSGIEYRKLEFAETAEAVAFVAALSRVLDSPHGATVDLEGPLEVWIAAAGPGPVVVFLTPAAFQTAGKAFAPMPSSEPAGVGDLPAESILVISGEPRAMGITEVERLLKPPAQPTR